MDQTQAAAVATKGLTAVATNGLTAAATKGLTATATKEPTATEATNELSDYEVLSALTAVIDPELGLDIVSLGLVYDVGISDEEVQIVHTLTSPGCPLGAEIAAAMTEEVSAICGRRSVNPVLVFSPPWGPDRMSEDAKFALGF